MRTIGANGVGRVHIEFDIANNEDLVRAKDGTLPRGKVRRMTIAGVVDPGAVMLVLPEAVAKQLGDDIAIRRFVRFQVGESAGG